MINNHYWTTRDGRKILFYTETLVCSEGCTQHKLTYATRTNSRYTLGGACSKCQTDPTRRSWCNTSGCVYEYIEQQI